MPVHVYLQACVGWGVRAAQAGLLHHGQDIADPVGQLCRIIDPAQHHPIQPHGMSRLGDAGRDYKQEWFPGVSQCILGPNVDDLQAGAVGRRAVPGLRAG